MAATARGTASLGDPVATYGDAVLKLNPDPQRALGRAQPGLQWTPRAPRRDDGQAARR
ncbi:hypothetical protein GCM10027199_81650 [Amycolatopsis magusensis]